MLEEVRRAQHRRTESTHVILIPRLMAPTWRKHLNKVSDIVSVPAGHSALPATMHEPLTIGIVFPLIRHKPWRLRGNPLFLELERQLRKVWKTQQGTKGPLLRKLWSLPRKLDSLSQKLVWKLLRRSQAAGVQDCPPRRQRRVEVEEKEG